MANTSKRVSRLLNKAGADHKAPPSVRLPKAMRKSAFKESRKPFHQGENKAP
jgi:hypothetical protein